MSDGRRVSIRIMSLAWQAQLRHGDKIVLLALADNANDEGACWPSIGTLGRKCGMDDRSIRRIITRLANAGHVTINERPGRSSTYVVHPGQRVTPDTVSGVTLCQGTPDTVSSPPRAYGPGTPDTVSPITIIEPSIEPSGNRGETRARATETGEAPPELEVRPPDDHEAMDRIQALYPRGANPPNWLIALRNARSLVDDDLASWAELVAVVERYARFVAASGTVANIAAHNFFDRRKGNYWQQPWDPPPTRAEARLTGNLDAADEAERRIFGGQP